MSDDKVEIINPPNNVKAKARVGGPGAVDAAALEAAENAIASMGDQYLEWVQDDLTKIDAAFKVLKATGGGGKEILDDVFQVSHDMKGQGGSFGYDLITAIGNQLCRMIERMEHVDHAEIDAIRAHIDAMKLVIAQKMKGNGGQAGDQILLGLKKGHGQGGRLTPTGANAVG
ncbi:MAG: Hpt domain-containing protein [Rhodospirillaceae bacterium]